MRFLVLSDLHANLQALEAVLDAASRAGYEQALVLGDLVGYGADPGAVIARTLALPTSAIVRGNHDKVAAGLAPADDFSPIAAAAMTWTASVLSPADRTALAALPKGPIEVAAGLVICHGAPFDEDYYVFTDTEAARALQTTDARLCLSGHTHHASLFGAYTPVDIAGGLIALPETGQLLANVGSVGQPRDGDPRAAYGLLDTEAGTLRFCRVDYDIAGAQAAIRAAGLPAMLADRLELGR